MAVYQIGDLFTNGFFVIATPSSPGNNTGEYQVSNTVGFQYFVTASVLDTYDQVGNYNGGGGSPGSGGSTSGSTTVVYVSSSTVPGSPFTQIAPGSTGSPFVVSTVPGSMVRLVNLSDSPQSATILGFDNSSTTSGNLLFAQQLDAQQIVDINVRTYHGITLSILGTTNSDYGVNVVNDSGGNALVTGFPYQVIAASTSSTTPIYAGACTVIGLRNNSLTNQAATLVGYDNASTSSGRVLFRQQLQAGQSVNIGEQANYGITVAIENGPTNTDYGVNVLYASTSS